MGNRLFISFLVILAALIVPSAIFAAPLPEANTGNLYVTWEDYPNTRGLPIGVPAYFSVLSSGLSIYGPDGSMMNPAAVYGDRYRGLAFDGPNALYVVSMGYTFTSSYGAIYKFEGSSSVSLFDAPAVPFATNLQTPEGIAINSEGHIFVTQRNWLINIGQLAYGSILEFDAAGNQLASFADQGLDLAFDSSDSLYFATGTELRKYDADNNYMATITASGLTRPGSIAFDAAGNYYVAQRGVIADLLLMTTNTPGSIFYFDSGDNFITSFTAPGLWDPYDLAIDEDGDLWVADAMNGKLFVFDASSPSSFFTVNAMQYPVHLAFVPQGDSQSPAIPEPATIVLLGAGLAALSRRMRRRRA